MTARRRWVFVAVGAALLVFGVLLLVSWEVGVFRATGFDRDVTGLECGVPLDNPGWRTGSPCHGAVNRQTAAAWVLILSGAVVVAFAIVTPRRMRASAADGESAQERARRRDGP